MRRNPWLATVLILAAAAAAPPGPDAAARHFDLRSSVPADEAVVDSLPEVRLTFTEVPQEGSTAARLLDAGGEAVETGPLTQDADDRRTFHLKVERALPGGAYTVSWRGMGSDGHAVRGDFSFTLAHP